MSATKDMNLTLKIWRQKDQKSSGKMVDYKVNGISPDSSFLEMMDVLNEPEQFSPILAIAMISQMKTTFTVTLGEWSIDG